MQVEVNKYKEYCNCFTRLKRFCKINYYHTKCIVFKQNTKKLWKLIDVATGKMHDKTSIIECIESENVKHYNGKVIANEKAKYFVNVGKKFTNNIPRSSKSIDDYNKSIKFSKQKLFMSSTNSQEILTIVLQLKNENSCGHDGISNNILKRIVTSIVDPLCIIFNKLLSEGIFPDLM